MRVEKTRPSDRNVDLKELWRNKENQAPGPIQTIPAEKPASPGLIDKLRGRGNGQKAAR
jgi:hypothetical protein